MIDRRNFNACNSLNIIGSKWPSNFYCLLFRYGTLGHNASQSRISTFYLLLDLMQFFDVYHAGQLDAALDVSLNRL